MGRSFWYGLGFVCVASACGDSGGKGSGSGLDPVDAGTDPETDAGQVEEDAGVRSNECDPAADDLTVPVSSESGRGWDLYAWRDRLHLAYPVPVCDGAGQRIDYVGFGSTGTPNDAVTLAGGGEGDCSKSRAPLLGPGADDLPRLYYTSSATGSDELFTTAGGGEAQQLTFDAAGSEDHEEHSTAVAWQTLTMLAYVNVVDEGSGTREQIVTRTLGTPESEVVSADRGLHVLDLSIAAFPGDEEPGGVLTWVATSPNGDEIGAQLLTRAGRPSGEPVVLSDKVAAFSNVNALILQESTQSDDIGAIAYTIGNGTTGALRLRTLRRTGAIGPEVSITNGALDARGIGLAPFASGYALVFRVLAQDMAKVHMRVTDPQGNTAPFAERILAQASTVGSAPEVFVTNDGRLTVAFTDVADDGSTTLRVLRATCDP